MLAHTVYLMAVEGVDLEAALPWVIRSLKKAEDAVIPLEEWPLTAE